MPPLQDEKFIARTHITAGELAEARNILQQAGKNHDNDAEVWFLLGLVENRLEKPGAAIRCFKKTIGLNPDSAAAYFNLALAQAAGRQLNEAAASLEKCLLIDADLGPAHLKASAVYARLGFQEKALLHIKQVLRKEPRNTEALIRSARIQLVFGNMEEAQKAFRLALEIKPDAMPAVAGLAGLYAKKGAIDKALDLIEPFVDGGNTPRPIAIVFSDICQTPERCRQAVELLEEILNASTQPRRHHRDLLVALAKLYDRLQQYDRAFETISEANGLKQAETDMARICNQTDSFISTWDPHFNARLPAAGLQIGHVQPVFIVGMPRSGTTLVEQILASHPAVYGAGELKDIGNIMMNMPRVVGMDTPYPECFEYLDRVTLNELADGYLQKLASMSGDGRRIVTDKLPTNFWNLGLIKRLFPGSIIIHCSRQPLDTCISCYFTDFAEENLHSFDLEDMGIYYRQYRKIMHHWKNTLGIRMLDIPYEDIVREPEHWSRQLIDYCGLAWDERCLNPHTTRRDVTTASFMQVRQPIYTSSIDRWKHYRAHIDPLVKALEG